jgi:hypothetical protein
VVGSWLKISTSSIARGGNISEVNRTTVTLEQPVHAQPRSRAVRITSPLEIILFILLRPEMSPLWAAIEGLSASPNKEEWTSDCGFLSFKIPQVRQETTLSEPDKSHTAP